MKYLKSFNENKVSIFDDKWSEFLPKSLKIITSNGDFDLKLSKEKSNLGHNSNISHLFNNIQISYNHSTYDTPEGCSDDGEPDFLCFDIDLVKNNDGSDSNPNALRLNINITYGDAMMSDFSIENPNKINVTHYNGINSLYDPKTKFAFDDVSLKQLIEFFNRFGFETTPDDFKFLDKELDNYEYKNDINKSSLTDRSDVIDLKGVDMVNIKKYNQFVNENVDYENAKIIDYIKEIFIPITDDFFYCVVKPSYDYNTKKYGFSIQVGNSGMMISKEYLNPYLEHLISYMGSIGYTEKVVDKPSIRKSFRFHFEFYPNH